MSRIGRMPIAVPAGVDVTIDGSTITVKGPKGTLTRTVHSNMVVEMDGAVITVSRPNDSKENRQNGFRLVPVPVVPDVVEIPS